MTIRDGGAPSQALRYAAIDVSRDAVARAMVTDRH